MKALSEGITDPKELRKIAGLNTVTAVYRTLDKMSLRREYHDALIRSGVDFDYLVKGVKRICDKSDSDKVRLKGLEILMRSLGVDKYDKVEDTSKSWEETILKLSQDEGHKQLPSPDGGPAEYEVDTPDTPKEEIERRKEDKAFADSFYE